MVKQGLTTALMWVSSAYMVLRGDQQMSCMVYFVYPLCSVLFRTCSGPSRLHVIVILQCLHSQAP